MSIKQRLQRVERRAAAERAQQGLAFGFCDDDAPGLVKVEGQTMTPEEFNQRYPNGWLVIFRDAAQGQP